MDAQQTASPGQLSALNTWLCDEAQLELPLDLLQVIADFITDWHAPLPPVASVPDITLTHAHASNNASRKDTAPQRRYSCQDTKRVPSVCSSSTGEKTAPETTPNTEKVQASLTPNSAQTNPGVTIRLPRRKSSKHTIDPYFHLDAANLSRIRCTRQSFEPANCAATLDFAPTNGRAYHVVLELTRGREVARHATWTFVTVQDREPPLVGTTPEERLEEMKGVDHTAKFSCSKPAFHPYDKHHHKRTTNVELLIDLPENSDNPLRRRLQVGTVSLTTDLGMTKRDVKFVRAPFKTLELCVRIVCDAENCTECGLGTQVAVVHSDLLCKSEFNDLLSSVQE